MKEYEELKQCPFCGAEAHVFSSTGDFRESDFHQVFCNHCRATMKSYEDKEVAIIMWNRRADSNG